MNAFDMGSLWDGLNCDTADEQDQSTTLVQFPQFRCLPTELRLRIWNYALPPRRTIAILERWRKRDIVEYTLTAESKNPALLFVNSEARSEALKHYRIAFEAICDATHAVYFDFAKDELSLVRCSPDWVFRFPGSLMQDMEQVTSLAISGPRRQEWLWTPETCALGILDPFENLQFLTVGKSVGNPFQLGRERGPVDGSAARKVLVDAFEAIWESEREEARKRGPKYKVGLKEMPQIVFWDPFPWVSCEPHGD